MAMADGFDVSPAMSQMSEGMEYVLVNGVIEKDTATWTGKLGGRVVTPDRR